MAQVELSTIPLNSIERIEITRGNSSAALYGDNAVGGVINIVAGNGAGGPPLAARIEAGFGSFNTKLGNVSTSRNSARMPSMDWNSKRRSPMALSILALSILRGE